MIMSQETYQDIITKYDYFSKEEWFRRYNLVKKEIDKLNIDGMIVTSTENIFYLTGYHTTGYYFFQCLYIPKKGEPFLLVRKMERLGAITQSWMKEENIHSYYDTENPIEQLSHRIRESIKFKRIGFEKESSLFPATYQEKLQYMISCSDFIDTGKIVEKIRECKSEEELKVIKLAGISTVEGIKGGINSICVGIKDNEIAANIYYQAFLNGGEYPACPSFIAVGERGSIGHATWHGREVKNDDLVFLEVSGCRYRYHCPMMRTCYIGKNLPPLMKEAEKLLLECFDKCMKKMKPGYEIRRVDLLSKEILNNNSFGYIYDNRLGYSVGCAFAPGWGEDTVITITSIETRKFKKNMVFHLIPFMMIPKIGTVGISETVVVKDNGAEPICDFPRKFILIDK